MITDPARELADICSSLQEASQERGDAYLATKFRVDRWSAEFYQMLFEIRNRADQVAAILEDIGFDDDHKTDALQHLEMIKRAFSFDALNSPWNHSYSSHISDKHVGALKMLAPSVRRIVSYERLDLDDLAALGTQVRELLEWLRDRQLREQDFFRQAIIEGLSHLLFRIERFKWLGWGYTLASLKQVIMAYMVLEQGHTDPNEDPNLSALLKRVKATLENVLDKFGVLREATDNLGFGLKAYGVITLALQGKQSVTGLIASLAE